MDKLRFAFGVLGNASALFLFLAPVITFKRIIKKKNTEQFYDVPYVMALLNNLLSAWKEKGKILGLLTLVVAVFSVVSFVFLFALDENNRKLFCGLAATIFSIVMHASPLTIIVGDSNLKCGVHAIFLVHFFFCGTCFFIYGLLGKDPFVAIPNCFGSGLGAVQLILYAIYRNNNGTEASTDGVDGSLDMEKPNAKPHHLKKPSNSLQPKVGSQV